MIISVSLIIFFTTFSARLSSEKRQRLPWQKILKLPLVISQQTKLKIKLKRETFQSSAQLSYRYRRKAFDNRLHNFNLQETAAAKEQLAALESRHADFLKLEASIREVHSMFIDVNNLVQMQGEMVTRIEDHVNSES